MTADRSIPADCLRIKSTCSDSEATAHDAGGPAESWIECDRVDGQQPAHDRGQGGHAGLKQ